MSDSNEHQPTVVAMRELLPPPPIPLSRRLVRRLFQLWPFMAWCAAAGGAVWLYVGESSRGHALAFDEVRELRVSPSVASRIATLSVELGQKVQEGDLIATLDERDLESRIRIAKAQLDRARARTEAERETLNLELQKRRIQFMSRRKAYEIEGRRLTGQIDALSKRQATDQAELEVLLPQIDRLRPLLDKNQITADRLEELLRKRSAVEKRISARMDEIQENREALARWAKLDPDRSGDPGLDVRLRPFELELKAEETRVTELELQREKYRVLSPATGILSKIVAQPGEWRSEGQEIVEILAPRPDRLTAFVTQRQISTVVLGTRATLRPRDLGGASLTGKVVRVGSDVEPIPARLRSIPSIPQWGRLVTIQLDQAKEPLPGEIYDVRFH